MSSILTPLPSRKQANPVFRVLTCSSAYLVPRFAFVPLLDLVNTNTQTSTQTPGTGEKNGGVKQKKGGRRNRSFTIANADKTTSQKEKEVEEKKKRVNKVPPSKRTRN